MDTEPGNGAIAAPGRELELSPPQLRRRVDPAALPFETTAEVANLEGTVGQPRAVAALEFGLGIHSKGYNLFVTGIPGSGRVTAVMDHLQRWAAQRPVPRDWVYVNNLRHPSQPRAVGLTAGRGAEFATDMDVFVETVRRNIDRAFESDIYQQHRRDLVAEIDARREQLSHELEAFAAQRGFGLQGTPFGIAVSPLNGEQAMTPEEVQKLPQLRRIALEQAAHEIHERLKQHVHDLHQLDKEASERLGELDRGVALSAIAPVLAGLREKYTGEAEILDQLATVQADIPDHLAEFRQSEREGSPGEPAEPRSSADGGRYRANLLVDNHSLKTAPVIIERNPTYYNLVGRVEYMPRPGSMVADFAQIRGGALHRANGGVLVMEALDVLRNPFSWEALKRSLRSQQVAIENLTEQLVVAPMPTLRPEPIPLDVKIVLIGSPVLFQLLQSADEDVHELFKVKVDFAPEMEWNDQHVLDYAAFISRSVEEGGLRHFDRGAVARVVEHSARIREDQTKLSTRFLDIADLVAEASFWASKNAHPIVQATDVDEAVATKKHRSDLIEERVQEMIARDIVVIDTEGVQAASVNGLSVVELGDHRFGQPTRVSARVAVGRGTVQSVEREIELSGPIHSKGVLILSGYLAEQYAQEWPLAMSATITFEQSYDEVEGDSASSTELYALLAALAGLPVRQSIAVTGSIDQHGHVQAVGGVNEKIEGFFHVCQKRGLRGDQGVIIPAANAVNLMLADEVVEAVGRGEFHIWAVRTIDQGLELLTGRPAGERVEGRYPAGSVHHLVEERLRGYAESLRRFAAPREGTDGSRAGAAVL